MILLRLGSIVAGAGLAALVFQLPVFAVTSVEVTGLDRIAREPLLQRLSLEGRNLLTISPEDAIAPLRQEPWVRDIRLQRQLPGRVVVDIEERRPSAVWQVSGRFFAIDRDGTILEELAGAGSLPGITDLDGGLPSPGDRRDAGAVELATRLTALVPQELGEPVRSYEYLSHGGLVVETETGKRARFGDASDAVRKLAVWKAVLQGAQAANLKAGHVDLRFGDRPFFRPQ